MPELPEVEVVKRSLESKIQNKIIKKVKINDIKSVSYTHLTLPTMQVV